MLKKGQKLTVNDVSKYHIFLMDEEGNEWSFALEQDHPEVETAAHVERTSQFWGNIAKYHDANHPHPTLADVVALLPNMPDDGEERTYLLTSIADLLGKGYTAQDAAKYIRHTEEYNPNLSEEIACSMMGALVAKYEPMTAKVLNQTPENQDQFQTICTNPRSSSHGCT